MIEKPLEIRLRRAIKAAQSSTFEKLGALERQCHDAAHRAEHEKKHGTVGNNARMAVIDGTRPLGLDVLHICFDHGRQADTAEEIETLVSACIQQYMKAFRGQPMELALHDIPWMEIREFELKPALRYAMDERELLQSTPEEPSRAPELTEVSELRLSSLRLNELEKSILRALGRNRLVAEQIAERTQYPCNSWFKGHLANLWRREILHNEEKGPRNQRGYRIEDKYIGILDLLSQDRHRLKPTANYSTEVNVEEILQWELILAIRIY